MANAKKNHSITAEETTFVIEGLRKLALQRDTLRKYASDEESDSFDEDKAEAYSVDIEAIRTLLGKLGDTKALVLKSERKAKASVKDTKAKAKASVKVTKAKAKPPVSESSDIGDLLNAILG